MKTFTAGDLFCGAGGSSTGLVKAATVAGRPIDLLAINHWSYRESKQQGEGKRHAGRD